MTLNKSRYAGVQGHIGRTPLLRLRRLSELTGCEILGKAEFINLAVGYHLDPSLPVP